MKDDIEVEKLEMRDMAGKEGYEVEAGLEEGRENVEEEKVRVRDWWNIFRKWFLDCITMGALLNTVLFLVIMGVLKGKSSEQITTDLRKVCVGQRTRGKEDRKLIFAGNV